MICRQLFEPNSSTSTYLPAERPGGQALIIDPAAGRVGQYLQSMEELELQSVMALDTHIHGGSSGGIGSGMHSPDGVTASGSAATDR